MYMRKYVQPPNSTLNPTEHGNHMLIQSPIGQRDRMGVAHRRTSSAESVMGGYDASRQVPGFSCPRVKNSKTKEDFRAGDENGK